LIPLPPHQHQAHYDEDGNIVLPSDHDESKEDILEPAWTEEHSKTIEEPQEETVTLPQEPQRRRQIWLELQGHVAGNLKSLLSEGARQYKWSARNARRSLVSGKKDMRTGMGHTWAFLTQPVWVPRRNKEPKEYSRLTLFLLDTVRFGGTFTAIFVALFTALNYQSFFELVTANLNPIEHARNVQALTASVDSALKEKLLRSPSLAVAGSDESDLLSFLPNVGPPENRIIIPKMGLNIPLVTPSYDALLREDWGQVEKDIQEALQMGVVHYPGTAKPGQAGNFFVTGHSSYYPWAQGNYKTVFARLGELEPGDDYWVYYGGDKHRYIIRSKKEVRPSDVTVLDQPVNNRTATLMTCTPIGTTLRRLIISSEEVDPQTGIALQVGERGKEKLPEVRPAQLPI